MQWIVANAQAHKIQSRVSRLYSKYKNPIALHIPVPQSINRFTNFYTEPYHHESGAYAFWRFNPFLPAIFFHWKFDLIFYFLNPEKNILVIGKKKFFFVHVKPSCLLTAGAFIDSREWKIFLKKNFEESISIVHQNKIQILWKS